MKRMKPEDFNRIVSSHHSMIELTELKKTYDNIMKTVEENRSLQKRIEALSNMGYQIIFYNKCGYGFNWNSSTRRFSGAFIKHVGYLGLHVASFSLKSGELDCDCLSYYFQVSYHKVVVRGYRKNPFTFFVEIPVTDFLKTQRKVKLKRISQTINE